MSASSGAQIRNYVHGKTFEQKTGIKLLVTAINENLGKIIALVV